MVCFSLNYTEIIAFAAFELFLLKRPGAEKLDSKEQQLEAKKYFEGLSNVEKEKLISNIIAGLPGAEEGYSLEQFQQILDTYANVDAQQLRDNLVLFLKDVNSFPRERHA